MAQTTGLVPRTRGRGARGGRGFGPLGEKLKYVIPSLFTLGNLTCGYLSIRFTLEDQFRHDADTMTMAAWWIVAGCILDMFDGLTARLLRVTTSLGLELDSLADLVTSGLAPSFLVYSLFIREQGGTIVLIAPLWFALATALRLARFNVTTATADPRYFTGLAAPYAALTLASFVICYFGLEQMAGGVILEPLRAITPYVRAGISIITIVLGLLMVSTIPYRSLKHVHLTGIGPGILVILVVMFVMALVAWPPLLFPLFAAGALSGPVAYVFRRGASFTRRS